MKAFIIVTGGCQEINSNAVVEFNPHV